MDCSPPGSTVYEIFQARILEWVAISFSRGSSQPRVRTRVSYTAANSLLTELQGKPNFIHRLIIKSISFDVPNVIVSLLSQFPFSISSWITFSKIYHFYSFGISPNYLWNVEMSALLHKWKVLQNSKIKEAFTCFQWQPTPVSLPGKSHGQRSLVGYSPWSHKESDTTEWLTHTPHTRFTNNSDDLAIWQATFLL